MRLSVALCTYNGEAYLREQLASLAAQTRLPDELVVYDDCSSDRTVSILNEFAASAPFPIHIAVNEANLGTPRNFQQAIERCTGDAIFPCDQDDVWRSEKLARFEADFQSNADVGLAASDLAVIDSAGQPLRRRVWDELPFTSRMQHATEAGYGPRLWLRANTVTGAASAFRADLREIVLPIPACWMHDAWIAFLTAAVSRVRLLRDPLTDYRSHPAQQIGSEPSTMASQMQRARNRNAEYFRRVAERFDAAADRLAAFRDHVRDKKLESLTRAKAEFARVQMRMRQGTRFARLAPAFVALVRGEYHRFGRGFKGLAADLFL